MLKYLNENFWCQCGIRELKLSYHMTIPPFKKIINMQCFFPFFMNMHTMNISSWYSVGRKPIVCLYIGLQLENFIYKMTVIIWDMNYIWYLSYESIAKYIIQNMSNGLILHLFLLQEIIFKNNFQDFFY